jgi:hypothetical protein
MLYTFLYYYGVGPRFTFSTTFLEWTCTSFEQSLAELYTIILEEHFQVALEMLEVGICPSL